MFFIPIAVFSVKKLVSGALQELGDIIEGTNAVW